MNLSWRILVSTPIVLLKQGGGEPKMESAFLRVKIVSSSGLHARPAACIVKACVKLACDIELWWQPRFFSGQDHEHPAPYAKANPRSILGLLNCALARGDSFYLFLHASGETEAGVAVEQIKKDLEHDADNELQTIITAVDIRELPQQLQEVVS